MPVQRVLKSKKDKKANKVKPAAKTSKSRTQGVLVPKKTNKVKATPSKPATKTSKSRTQGVLVPKKGVKSSTRTTSKTVQGAIKGSTTRKVIQDPVLQHKYGPGDWQPILVPRRKKKK